MLFDGQVKEKCELNEKGRPKREVKNKVNLSLMFSLYDKDVTSGSRGNSDDDDAIEQWCRNASRMCGSDRCVHVNFLHLLNVFDGTFTYHVSMHSTTGIISGFQFRLRNSGV